MWVQGGITLPKLGRNICCKYRTDARCKGLLNGKRQCYVIEDDEKLFLKSINCILCFVLCSLSLKKLVLWLLWKKLDFPQSNSGENDMGVIHVYRVGKFWKHEGQYFFLKRSPVSWVHFLHNTLLHNVHVTESFKKILFWQIGQYSKSFHTFPEDANMVFWCLPSGSYISKYQIGTWTKYSFMKVMSLGWGT